MIELAFPWALLLLPAPLLVWRFVPPYQVRVSALRFPFFRRIALKEIAAADNDSVALAEILRRTALVAFPRADVAALHGERWLDFLDRTYGGCGFRNGPGRAVATAPYARFVGPPDLAPLAFEWVRGHRRPGSAAP